MSGVDQRLPFVPVNIAILTISDTRNLENDASGALLEERATEFGHKVVERTLVADHQPAIEKQLRTWISDPRIDIVLSTGGTGVTARDVTPEAVRRVIEKEIPGFGELFRYLSYRLIGTATIQSRAIAGVANATYIFALPGSTSACKDAWDEILQFQLDSRHRPCNFVELLPRLKETVSL